MTKLIRTRMENYQSPFTKIYNTTEYEFHGTIKTSYDILAKEAVKFPENYVGDSNQILSMIKYQFNIEQSFLSSLDGISVERSRKSNRIKEFSINKERWGTIRASDGVIIPAKPLIYWLHQVSQFPANRVVMANEVKDFIIEGKSAFCKFCDSIDPLLRPGDETLIVTLDDELLGWGQLQYTSEEINSFNKGLVVKTRGGVGKQKNNSI